MPLIQNEVKIAGTSSLSRSPKLSVPGSACEPFFMDRTKMEQLRVQYFEQKATFQLHVLVAFNALPFFLVRMMFHM